MTAGAGRGRSYPGKTPEVSGPTLKAVGSSALVIKVCGHAGTGGLERKRRAEVAMLPALAGRMRQRLRYRSAGRHALESECRVCKLKPGSMFQS